MPSDLTVGQFVYVIRKRIKLSPERAIFIFIDNKLPPSGTLTKGFAYARGIARLGRQECMVPGQECMVACTGMVAHAKSTGPVAGCWPA